ncbi:UvrD-helicase domain-containing protein [Pseudomonas syringae]|uniref:UvrD-helicase domain-containing protein n=3 Tax=Pseudomonas syringae group TaxID=136849 RepID=UPI0018E6264C|nr:UvrD-helicase domain-containing protein [Pseudomonas syringae]MBI6786206.1 UvrD-helicase domain-containing protein [Pseudomonas syringae]
MDSRPTGPQPSSPQIDPSHSHIDPSNDAHAGTPPVRVEAPKGGVFNLLTNKILDVAGFQQSSAWKAGREVGTREGFRSGRIKGLELGRAEGHTTGHLEGRSLGLKEGFSQGHSQGLDEGKLIVELRPGIVPIPEAPTLKEPGLFKDWRFAITPDIADQIRKDVAHYLPKQPPSEDQWSMILSTAPTTSVVAGAGSGKSTTMVLRLIVLYHYLKIDLSCLTVVTFTRESKLDFAKKVREVFDLWGYEVSEKKSLEIVRTFHSRILSFAKSIEGLRDVKAFEFLDNKDDEDERGGSMFKVNLGETQLDLMNTVYQELFETNETFRAMIGELYQRSLLLEEMDKDHPDVLERKEKAWKMANIDGALCDQLEDLWEAAGHWPIAGIVPTKKTVRLLRKNFRVNGYIPEIDAYVILGVDDQEPDDLKVVDEYGWFMRMHVRDKRTLFQAFCSKRVVYLSSYGSASQSIDALRGRVNGCPKFHYKVRGEISATYIMDAFFSTASFIENLGLDAVDAVKNMTRYSGDPDATFFDAMSIYWAAFNSRLLEMSPPIMTFNSMFAMFSERGQKNLWAVSDSVLLPMATLLIDEFQDVGANTISWVRAVFKEIERRGLVVKTRGAPAYASLMAVGDDWQSIYGWRGSSPRFLMQFDKEFKSPKQTQVFMQENHRSHQMVVDAAEAIVNKTPGFDNKHGVAVNSRVTGNQVPVEVRELDWDHIVQMAEHHYDAGRSILMLYRKRDTKKEAKAKLLQLVDRSVDDKRKDDIKFLTYHSSKGLQADAVFLLGDCEVTTSSPSRNDFYAQAGMANPGEPCGYDIAQQHEALRTAYVAITRAVTYCYWYFSWDERVPASEKASWYINADQPYWNVVTPRPAPPSDGIKRKR